MIHDMHEPCNLDEADEVTIAEFSERICSKDTFSRIGQVVPTVVDNAAIAVSIAPRTESPIEVLFGVEALKYFRVRYRKHPTMRFECCEHAAEYTFVVDHTLLIYQYPWRNYRIDWVLKVTFLRQPYFFIECDGREFHSSEQQLLRDRLKDEAIRSAGIQVFRFTGSELERNASACVRIVFAAMELQYRQEWAAGLHRRSA